MMSSTPMYSLQQRTALGRDPRHHQLRQTPLQRPGRRRRQLRVAAEKKEYYDYKDMPPLPHVPVSRIHIPEIAYTVVDQSSEAMRTASLAIFFDIYQDGQYGGRLSRKSAMTALCMYDREDVEAARNTPGDFPNIDLLYKVYDQGLDYKFVVEEMGSTTSSKT